MEWAAGDRGGGPFLGQAEASNQMAQAGRAAQCKRAFGSLTSKVSDLLTSLPLYLLSAPAHMHTLLPSEMWNTSGLLVADDAQTPPAWHEGGEARPR